MLIPSPNFPDDCKISDKESFSFLVKDCRRTDKRGPGKVKYRPIILQVASEVAYQIHEQGYGFRALPWLGKQIASRNKLYQIFNIKTITNTWTLEWTV